MDQCQVSEVVHERPAPASWPDLAVFPSSTLDRLRSVREGPRRFLSTEGQPTNYFPILTVLFVLLRPPYPPPLCSQVKLEGVSNQIPGRRDLLLLFCPISGSRSFIAAPYLGGAVWSTFRSSSLAMA